jgi:regulator of replication initiation timing
MSEISSLRAKQTELQNELKIKTEELSSHKHSLAESVSDNKILKFRLEKDESVLSESKVMVNEFRAEITNSQQKYLEVKRELDNHRFSQDEQYLLMDQLRHEV